MTRPTPLPEIAEYLLGFEACNRNVLNEILERTLNARQPLGMILMRRGTLRMSQVSEILGLQAEEPETRFGDLAVREGLCTRADVEEALAQQRASGADLLEQAIQDERVDRRRLMTSVLAYVRTLEQRLDEAHTTPRRPQNPEPQPPSPEETTWD